MANWITHAMIADEILKELPHLDKRGFYIGSIAPDCNVENEDWSAFTPPREVTHFMDGKKKDEDDYTRFLNECVLPRKNSLRGKEESAFWLGYYAHLIEDAEYTLFLVNEDRVKAVWRRIEESGLYETGNVPRTWPGIKRVMDKNTRLREVYAIEAEYLAAHPESGYLTYILPLTNFPDYAPWLPAGAIERKIGVMGTVPPLPEKNFPSIGITRSELYGFVQNTSQKVIKLIREAEKKMSEFAFIDDLDFLKTDEIFLRLVKVCPAQPEKGFVPAYRFEICLADATAVGTCDLRIGHNSKTYIGGNIGYTVFEPYRGHRYAFKACGLLKLLASKHGMTHLIITCAPDNTASEKTILRAGGEYIETAPIPEDDDMYKEGKRLVKVFDVPLFRKMRREKQQLSNAEAEAILLRGKTGVLCVNGDNGWPYAVPMNYHYEDGCIYLHAAKTGHKADAIKANDKVSFTVVDKDDVIPEKLTTAYQSAIAFGRAELVTDKEEMFHFARALARRYNCPEKGIQDDIDENGSGLLIIRITISHLTGKRGTALMG